MSERLFARWSGFSEVWNRHLHIRGLRHGKPIANIWQGIFPVLDTKDDEYADTAPVGCFKPNG
ncbi:hypothetical protein [Pseudorhodoplanes sinuspersici]|uniref:Uncharacterized protein n=1 Tax=Pseudorhodoplanes sinuspersici TaxID=1235591 RepID=A0A1W6ZLQ4_9HYPH|nr:hypothetical protein [Pseudorhodoplanes sinuspersici]ARP98291.1 hypothetical protein CAK95_03705 [Pseudorhodoplanes sinuspersici]